VRLLIDECLHTSLTQVANNAGHEAHHVNWRGWSVRKVMAESELHAGLIVTIPNVTPTVQRELFQRALLEASKLPI
jgi:hypothetical protein